MAVNTYIAEGFMADCEELIYSLTEEFSTVDYHNFCTYWKEKEYDTMFYGRQSGVEVVEFTEEALQVARQYFITKTQNYEDQVVGLFICYSILTIQPYKRLVPLRLVPEDVPAIEEFEAIARKNKRNDVLMILGKLLIIGPTQFHVSVRERAMDLSIRKYYDGSTRVPEFMYRRWYGLLNRFMFKTFEDIDAAEDAYALSKKMMKMKIKSHFPGTNVKIDMSTRNLGKPLLESLKNLIDGEKADDTKESEEVTMTSVKEKAMKKTVDPMKHLHGLTERKQPLKHSNTTSGKRDQVKTKLKGLKRFRDSSSSSEREEVEEVLKGISLPELEYLAGEEREDSPEDLCRGFSEPTSNDKTLDKFKRNVVVEIEPNDDEKPVKGKGKGKGKSSKKSEDSIQKSETDLANKETGNKQAIFNAPSNNGKGPLSNKIKMKQLKKSLNKKIKLSNLDSEEYILPDLNLSDEEFIEVPDLEPKVTQPAKRSRKQQKNEVKKAEQIQAKTVTVQSEGGSKEVLEFEINNIPLVIRSDERSQPFEIEVIDNYKGTNNRYEEMCEVSDDEENSKNAKSESNDKGIAKEIQKDDSRKAKETVQVLDDDSVEVFAVYYDEEQTNDDDETIQKALNKVLKKEVVKKAPVPGNKREMKRPELRSKLKKMGILPVANFKNDSN